MAEFKVRVSLRDVFLVLTIAICAALAVWVSVAIQHLGHRLQAAERDREVLSQQVKQLGGIPRVGRRGNTVPHSPTASPGPASSPGPTGLVGSPGPTGSRAPVYSPGTTGSPGLTGSACPVSSPRPLGLRGLPGTTTPAYYRRLLQASSGPRVEVKGNTWRRAHHAGWPSDRHYPSDLRRPAENRLS